MANNKVCCEETEVICTCAMNDRDYLNDILESEKNLKVNLATVLNEASNDKFHDELYQMFENVGNLQREAYDLAWNNGWYTLEEAEQTKINQKEKELQKKLEELSYEDETIEVEDIEIEEIDEEDEEDDDE